LRRLHSVRGIPRLRHRDEWRHRQAVSMNGGTPELFSTGPAASNTPREQYLDRVADVARWSERHGCRGMLVYSDNRQVDPWLVAQYVIHHTTELCPLVAVQPVYMHPYSVAKLVTSLAWLHGRRVCLNLVAGGFKNDLEALNDSTEHDRRYERLTDYATLIGRLLSGAAGRAAALPTRPAGSAGAGNGDENLGLVLASADHRCGPGGGGGGGGGQRRAILARAVRALSHDVSVSGRELRRGLGAAGALS